MNTGILTVLIGLVMMSGAATDELTTLDPFQWEHRVILVRTDSDASTIAGQLNGADVEIVERHILWFVLTPEGIKTNYPGSVSDGLAPSLLAEYFSDPVHRAILIGKDGGVKDECSRLDLPYLFYLIDQMPMRQQEMQSQP